MPAPIPARLTIVTLGCRDLGAMRAFYDRLGFVDSVGMDSFACYVLGGVGLGLFGLDDLAHEAGAASESAPGPWRGVTLACNVDRREDVDPTWQAWVAAGARALTEPEDRPWGGRTGYVADPEDNRWEIAWAPMARFDDDGALAAFA